MWGCVEGGRGTGQPRSNTVFLTSSRQMPVNSKTVLAPNADGCSLDLSSDQSPTAGPIFYRS